MPITVAAPAKPAPLADLDFRNAAMRIGRDRHSPRQLNDFVRDLRDVATLRGVGDSIRPSGGMSIIDQIMESARFIDGLEDGVFKNGLTRKLMAILEPEKSGA